MILLSEKNPIKCIIKIYSNKKFIFWNTNFYYFVRKAPMNVNGIWFLRKDK